MEIGENILKFRKEKGYSQEDLAQVLGVARQTISKWELGETSPDLKQAMEIAKTFEVNLDEFVNNKIENKNITKKKMSKLKIVGIVLYFGILITLILITIYFLVNKDFTRHYQTEFTCTLNDELYQVNLSQGTNNKYYMYAVSASDFNKMYVGETLQEALENMTILKSAMIDNGAKCK